MKASDAVRSSDEALVLLWQKDPGGPRGRAAAEELFGRWEERVYFWCYRMVRDHDRATDLAQEALLEAWRSLGQFQARSRFSTWLYSVARHRVLRIIRRERSWLWEDDEVLADLPHGDPPPHVDLERAEERERVLALMESALDDTERVALWLKAWEGLAVDEITETLGLNSASGARGVLQSARRKLRAALSAERLEGPR